MPVAACWPQSEVLLYVFVGFGISLTMSERVEQRYCIKFCYKLGDSQSETIRKIQQVFGDDAIGVTQIKEWFNRFKNGRTSVESEQRSGRPQTARNAAVVESEKSGKGRSSFDPTRDCRRSWDQ